MGEVTKVEIAKKTVQGKEEPLAPEWVTFTKAAGAELAPGATLQCVAEVKGVDSAELTEEQQKVTVMATSVANSSKTATADITIQLN